LSMLHAAFEAPASAGAVSTVVQTIDLELSS
jgi:hypothetical protein